MPKHKYKASTIISVGQDKPKAAKSRHYVDKKAFYQAMVERKAIRLENEANGLPPPPVSEFIGECLLQIATNMAKKYNFTHQQHIKDDMIGNAVAHAISKIDKFDPEVSNNPFSYFTQLAYYEFLGVISSEKNQTYIKFKAITGSETVEELIDNNITTNLADMKNKDIEYASDHTLDYMSEFVDTFEEKHITKRKPRRKKTKNSLLGD